MRQIILEESWKRKLLVEFKKDYMKVLSEYLRSEKQKKKKIFPPSHQIFRAFDLTSFDNVRVVILGQDPYHGFGQAHGLSFSVDRATRIPPSLENIFKELEFDLGINKPKHGNLEKWGHQGVLMLNSILTVEEGKPASHSKKGWEQFTDEVLNVLNHYKRHVVYILWGQKAQEKCKFLDKNKNLIIATPHPSPFSARSGFFGSKPFSRTNQYLKKHEIQPIDWNIS